MVRWRLSLVLALVLLVLPGRLQSKSTDDEEDEDRHADDAEEDDDDDDEEEEEESPQILDKAAAPPHRRAHVASPPTLTNNPTPGLIMTKTPKRRPLECYVCAYKSETPLRACLDPTKFRVHTITCHSVDDRCFTSVLSKGEQYEAVVRGCRSGCVGSPETTCCESPRCNNQAFAMPMIQPRVNPVAQIRQESRSKSSNITPPNIFYFVTILLILQTTSKVSFI